MKKSFVRVMTLVLALVMLLSLVACGGKQSTATTEADASAENGGSTEATATAYKDTLIWAQGADVTSLDPHQGKETPAVEVTCQIFDTLVTVDAETNEIVPQIAESWEQTDAQTYVFKIRQGIKFHDGSDLTAEDVKFSLDRARNSAAVSYIVNFIEDVTVDDEYTVTVKTNAPYSPTLRNLAIPFAAIVPKAVVEADEDAFILNPVGSGPYCFVEWKQGDHVTLKAFDDYYAGKAATENLIMKVIPETSQRSIALETGEIDLAYDLAVNDIPKINDNDKLMVYEIPSLTCWYVSMNMNKEPFNNPLVREALAMAIDRQTIIDSFYNGYGLAAGGFLILTLGSFGLMSPAEVKAVGASDHFVSQNWLISTYLVLTFAELLLSPMGISFVSKVAPPKYKGMMMGCWFAATAVGNYATSLIGYLWGSGMALWMVWSVLIVLCLLSALFIFSVMRKLESATASA